VVRSSGSPYTAAETHPPLLKGGESWRTIRAGKFNSPGLGTSELGTAHGAKISQNINHFLSFFIDG
jgi:hypothetical protein